MLLILFGAVLRQACYNALGPNFTFAHTTQADHQLIISGPYAYVRHPSYTAVVSTYGGTIALVWIRGGLLAFTRDLKPDDPDCLFRVLWVLMLPVTYCAAVLFSLWSVFIIVTLLRRAPLEDETLHERFGDE